LRLSATFIILYLVFLKVDFKNFSSVFLKLNFGLIVIAFLIYVLQFIISTIKWRQLVNFLGVKLKFIFYLKLNLIGLFYATIMPGGLIAGDLVKGYRVFKTSQDRRALINAIFMDRITGFTGLLLSIVAIYFFGGAEGFPYLRELTVISAIALFLFFCFLLFFGKTKAYLMKMTGKINPRIANILEKIFAAVSAYLKNIHLLILAIGIGILIYLVNAAVVYALAGAAGIKISFADIFIVNCLANFALIVAPITFFGFGIRESFFVYFLGSIGLARESALLLSLSFGVISLTLSLLGGIIEGANLFVKKT